MAKPVKEILNNKYAWITYVVTALTGTGAFVGLPAGEKLVDNIKQIENRQDLGLTHDSIVIAQNDEIIFQNKELKALFTTDLYLRYNDRVVDSAFREVKKGILAEENWNRRD